MRALRRSPDPDRPEQLHRRADDRRRLSQFVVQDSSNGRCSTTPTLQAVGRVRADPRRPLPCGSYNRAVRAPNIQELFAPQFVGLDGSTIRAPASPITADRLRLSRSGPARSASATPANPAGQYNGLLGGNPDLSPEKATTKTVGVVLQPRFLPSFALTIDYGTSSSRTRSRASARTRSSRPASASRRRPFSVAGLRPDPSRSGADRSG